MKIFRIIAGFLVAMICMPFFLTIGFLFWGFGSLDRMESFLDNIFDFIDG